MKYQTACDWCGKPVIYYPCKVNKKHHFCSRECLLAFRSKKTNPDHYQEYGDFSKIRERFCKMNQVLNPKRMTPETRKKLRESRLGTGDGKTYTKTYGRHTHRVVAEQMLGRPLAKGEIVHHIDGNKRNNAPDNLQVMTQSEHARLHMQQRRKKEVTKHEI